MKHITNKKMVKSFAVVVGMLLMLAGNVFAWSLPTKVGGGVQVDVKGLTGKADKLMESVISANEKLGLALADVLTMTGKAEEAQKLRQEIATLKADQNKRNGAKELIMKLDGSFANLTKTSLKKVLEQAGKALISTTSIGSALLNITDAVNSDKDAVKEARTLSEELSTAVKSASTNPALAPSLTDLKSALDAVALVIDSIPKQIEFSTTILKELREFADANGVAMK